MGKIFSISCKECDINIEIMTGVGKKNPIPVKNFFCNECKIISHKEICRQCKKKLTKIINEPKIKFSKSKKLEYSTVSCPNCGSADTKITFVGEWD